MNLSKITCLMAGLSLLTACATTTTNTTPTPSANAKDALASAVKSQMYRSFGYQTDVYVSNHARRDGLANAPTPSDTLSEQQCNKAHDDAYVALLKKAQAKQGNGKDLTSYADKHYADEQKTIKSDYQACLTAVFGSVVHYEPFDFDGFYQAHHALSADEKAQAFLGVSSVHVAVQSATSQDETPQDTELDAKKAKLLDAYLLQPSHISVMGSYHPLKGQITALPTLQYEAKNLHLSVNQPILLDIKAGGVYLWADNFALANSQFLDKNLGDKWKNKWLFLPFNDGSLPDDFFKDFTKAYLDAKKESFLATPNDSFVWVNADSLAGVPYLADNLPKATFDTMMATPRIIKNELGTKDKAYRDYVFADVLYNTIIKKYPDLALEQVLGYNPNTMERDIIDGESVITVRNADDGTPAEETLNGNKMNARFFAIMFLSSLNQKVQGYYYALDENQNAPAETAQDGTPSLVYYGIDGNKISWINHRYPLQKQLNDLKLDSLQKQGDFTKKLANTPMVVDVFTKIHQDEKQTQAFSRLPSHLQTPTADNTVNVLEYKDEFLKSLQSSDDKYLQTLMGLVFGATDEPN